MLRERVKKLPTWDISDMSHVPLNQKDRKLEIGL
jgi:hypothetical protein